MRKSLFRIMAMSLSLCMMCTFAGCSKGEEEISYVTEYEYVSGTASGNEGENNNSSDKNNSDKGTNNNSSNQSNVNSSSNQGTNNNSSGNDRVTTTGRPKEEAEKEAQSRVKDLKGRTITYVAYWDAVGRSTDEGKIITKLEKMLNCKFEHRKLNDYKPLYASILSGKPIADIYATKFEETMYAANKKLLTPLDTLSNFNFKSARWNQSSIKENTFDGHVYAATSEPQVRQVLLYNKDMFKANNWPDLYEYQKKGKLTWDVLYDVMTKAVKLGTESDPMFGLIPTGSLEEFAQTLVNANGVCALERKGGYDLHYGLNSEAGIYALNTLQKWNKEELLFNSLIYGWDSGTSFFTSGKSPMLMVSQNNFGIMNKCSFEYGMVLFPHGPNSKKDLISYQVNAESIPAGVKNANDVALFWDLYQDLKYADKDFFINYYDAAPNGSVKYTIEAYQKGIQTGNYIHDWATGWGVSLNDYYKQVAYGETTAASMVKSVEQKMKGLIADFLK